MHLPRRLGSLHDLPDSPEAYDAVLADVTEQALARLTPEGNLEHSDRVDDIGDPRCTSPTPRTTATGSGARPTMSSPRRAPCA